MNIAGLDSLPRWKCGTILQVVSSIRYPLTIFRTFCFTLITKTKINTMKFALSLCFVAAFSSTPAMAGLRSSHHSDGETREEITISEAVRHGRQSADNRHHRRHHKGRHQGAALLNDEETDEFDTKIVGGNAASIGEYPYFGELV